MVNSSTFRASVNDILKDYAEDVEKDTEQVVKSVAKESVKKLKATSPKRTGKYAKGWAQKTEKSRLSSTATVYGKSGTYQLAHLLEFGHAKRGGGRVAGNSHIAPVESWATTQVEKELKQRI